DNQAQPLQQRQREVFPDQALLFSGPIHYCATAVNEAYRRSSQHVALATQARQRQDHEAAAKHLDDAFKEVSYLKNDHWYLADLWNFKGCLLYDQGFHQEAREIWERALLIAEEWPEKTKFSLPTIQSNLALARGTLGF
ncbi:MAG: tetratricopeptide repeat protein, partial [Cyanobacteria bacterium]|nr:tetratricopeptide repeat protein [Cyanobacteriota bacterium]